MIEGKEIVICAAIRCTDGSIIRGHRHGDALRTAQSCGKTTAHSIQGFITSANRFVDREEGLRLQKAAGIPSADPDGYRGHNLFSEDLY